MMPRVKRIAVRSSNAGKHAVANRRKAPYRYLFVAVALTTVAATCNPPSPEWPSCLDGDTIEGRWAIVEVLNTDVDNNQNKMRADGSAVFRGGSYQINGVAYATNENGLDITFHSAGTYELPAKCIVRVNPTDLARVQSLISGDIDLTYHFATTTEDAREAWLMIIDTDARVESRIVLKEVAGTR